MLQLVYFASGQQKRACHIFVRALAFRRIGLVVHQLAPLNLPLRTHRPDQDAEGLDDWLMVLLPIQHSMVDTPGQAVAEEPGAARFRIGQYLWIVEADPPKAVRGLTFH